MTRDYGTCVVCKTAPATNVHWEGRPMCTPCWHWYIEARLKKQAKGM